MPHLRASHTACSVAVLGLLAAALPAASVASNFRPVHPTEDPGTVEWLGSDQFVRP